MLRNLGSEDSPKYSDMQCNKRSNENENKNEYRDMVFLTSN